jgi:hypothetical protein
MSESKTYSDYLLSPIALDFYLATTLRSFMLVIYGLFGEMSSEQHCLSPGHVRL